jgi:TolB-like protein/Tfp pilus assembly protein PilF
MGESTVAIPPLEGTPERRLDSWKEIAAYLNRDVTTVQRWEKREGMPVHRHVHASRGSVYAVAEELDAWVRSRRLRPEEPSAQPATEAEPRRSAQGARRRWGLWLAAAALCMALAAAGWMALRHRGGSAPAIRSLAVLPLRNLSGDPAQEYLAEGMTEALIGKLAGIHSLRVTSRTSVMRFRDTQQSAPEIARTLGVDALVEGSVVRDGSRIRVTAQLIRGATDEHFWSATYDREMRDALTLESELAESIADKVEATVTGAEQRRFAAAHPVAPEVYDAYLKSWFVLNNANSKADLEQSIGHFEDAVRRDPNFAPPYLGLATAWTMLGMVAVGADPANTRPKVIGYARQALTLDPDLVAAHALLANVLQEEWRWSEAETEYRRALDLNPNDANARSGFALWLLCEGHTDEALASIEEARALDPVAVSGGDVAWILFQSHRFDEAVNESRNALKLQPNDPGTLLVLGFALVGNNQPADAIPVLERAIANTHGNPAASGVLIRAYAHAGRRHEALALLAKLQAQRKAGYVPAAAFVNAYLGLDDREQAFYWLEQAYKEKSNILQFVKTHPYFDPIRSDPRFADLIRRVGLG